MSTATNVVWGSVAVALALVGWLAFRGGAPETPESCAECDEEPPILVRQPSPSALLTADIGGLVPFRGVERSGREITDDDLRGKVLVVDFIFTNCPGPCLAMTRHMAELQESLRERDDVRLVSFTVDPDRDTPEVLAAYAEKAGADPERWLFVRCDEATVKRVMQEGLKLGSGEELVFHSQSFALLGKHGRARAYYGPVTDADWLPKILHDIDVVAREPAEPVKERP